MDHKAIYLLTRTLLHQSYPLYLILEIEAVTVIALIHSSDQLLEVTSTFTSLKITKVISLETTMAFSVSDVF